MTGPRSDWRGEGMNKEEVTKEVSFTPQCNEGTDSIVLLHE